MDSLFSKISIPDPIIKTSTIDESIDIISISSPDLPWTGEPLIQSKDFPSFDTLFDSSDELAVQQDTTPSRELCSYCGPPFSNIEVIVSSRFCSFECAERFISENIAKPNGFTITKGKADLNHDSTIGSFFL
jgi:hypothetical protein